MGLNPQAEELNEQIKRVNKVAYELLSKRGKGIFFPKKGILSQTAEAKGKKINATIGIALDDDGSPMRLDSIGNRVSLAPDFFKYAPSFGKQELRKKWKDMIYEKNPSLQGKDVSLPIVTSGLTHGLSTVAYLFVDEGDRIIIPDLFWGNYRLIFVNSYGAVLDTFEMFRNGGFNISGLREKLLASSGKKIVLLNFPNNPTGYTIREDEAREIIRVIKEAAETNKILVVIDDAYFGLVYREGIYRQSLFSELAGLHENVLAIKVDGATKEDYVWGFRVGFITYGIKNGKELYPALESKTAGAIRGTISNASNLSQSLLYEAYSSGSYMEEKKSKYEILKSRFEEVVKILSEHKEYEEEFSSLPFNSGYFMCIKLKNVDAEKIRQTLLNKYNTGVIAMGDILRIAFSSVRGELIPSLFENIYKACKNG